MNITHNLQSPLKFNVGNRAAKKYTLSFIKLQLELHQGKHPTLFRIVSPKCEQRLAYASGGWTRNLHNAIKYSTVAYYSTVTSTMTNPIDITVASLRHTVTSLDRPTLVTSLFCWLALFLSYPCLMLLPTRGEQISIF